MLSPTNAFQGLRAVLAASAGGQVLAAASSRGYSAAAGEDDSQPRPLSQDPGVQRARLQQQPLAAAAATHAGERAAQPRARSMPLRHSLSSINDPENWWLGGSPMTSEQPVYWLGSSISNAEYKLPSSLRSSTPSPLPAQGFSTARTQPTVQRIIFRSSMADPPLPLGSLHAEDEKEQ